MDPIAFPSRRNIVGASVIAATAAFMPGSALGEVSGPCNQAVGTFLTKNTLTNADRTATSRSLLVLTNGGHAIRFDSDEEGAAMDSRPFGNSAGTWRCDGVEEGGTVRLTATMLDFSYPDAEGDPAQIARIDVTGTYAPQTETMELTGKLGFLPLTSDAQDADALAKAENTTAITFRAVRIALPLREQSAEQSDQGIAE